MSKIKKRKATDIEKQIALDCWRSLLTDKHRESRLFLIISFVFMAASNFVSYLLLTGKLFILDDKLSNLILAIVFVVGSIVVFLSSAYEHFIRARDALVLKRVLWVVDVQVLHIRESKALQPYGCTHIGECYVNGNCICQNALLPPGFINIANTSGVIVEGQAFQLPHNKRMLIIPPIRQIEE